ncbi:phage protease [Termitidicoccus mucosus]|uniref:Mu-like prophage I protein n=1 Tax=Termitidicoccus mucosus TaxID=1184151 RepID=A0A178IJP0_9BACT|nr:hypothetical protein AW736_13880 [Opitutaceae bacterium TSB47]
MKTNSSKNKPPFSVPRLLARISPRIGFASHCKGVCKPAARVVAINETGPERLVAAVAAFNDVAPAADQDWVRLSPYGEFPNEVGLQVFDRAAAEEMTADFNSILGKAQRLFRGPPYYVGHPDDPRWAQKNPGAPMRAVARVKKMEARDDGLYGFVAFNDEGKSLVSGDAAPYAFHSPRWGMRPITHKGRKAFRPVLLYSMGLTNTPNIPGNSIGLNEPADSFSAMNKEHIIKLLAALGKTVAADATDEQFAAAINEAVPFAQAAVTASASLPGMKTQLTIAQNEAAALRDERDTAKAAATSERAARAGQVVTIAINTGRITEAQRAEWTGKLVAASDFAAIEAGLTELKPAINTQSKVAGLGERKAEVAASAERITAINEAVARHCKENGLDPRKDYHRAFTAVKAAKPDLFTTATN